MVFNLNTLSNSSKKKKLKEFLNYSLGQVKTGKGRSEVCGDKYSSDF